VGLTVFAKRTANAPVKFRRRGPALAYLLLRLSPGQKRFLVAGSLLILALTFGTTLRQDWSTAGVQLIYAAIYAALLTLDRRNVQTETSSLLVSVCRVSSVDPAFSNC